MVQSPKVNYDLMYHNLFGKELPVNLKLRLMARDLPDIPVYDFEPPQDHSASYGFIEPEEEPEAKAEAKAKAVANHDLPLFFKIDSTKTLPDTPVYDVEPIFVQSENLEEDEVEEDEVEEPEAEAEAEAEAKAEAEAEAEPNAKAEAEADAEAEAIADNSDGFMANTDLDRAEAMIMQIFGGDENALSSIRSRDMNRESALRNAVASERNDAITREITKLEKEKEEATKQTADEEERKIKHLEALKNYKDAVAKFKKIKTENEPTSQEYQLAWNELEESAKKLAQFGENKLGEIEILKNTELDGKTNSTIKKIISEIGITWKNKPAGEFSEADKNDALKTIEKLKSEPYATPEDLEKIQTVYEAIINKPSKEEVDTERERQKKEILKLVNDCKTAMDHPKKRKEILTTEFVDAIEKYKLPSDEKTYTKSYSNWEEFEKDYAGRYEFVDYKGVKL